MRTNLKFICVLMVGFFIRRDRGRLRQMRLSRSNSEESYNPVKCITRFKIAYSVNVTVRRDDVSLVGNKKRSPIINPAGHSIS